MKRLLFLVPAVCVLVPFAANANIVGNIYPNNNIVINNTTLNIFFNFFGINAVGNLVIVNLGGIFIDPPVVVDTADAMDPFCNVSNFAGGGTHWNTGCTSGVPQPTASTANGSTSVTFSPASNQTVTLSGLNNIHYGFGLGNGSISGIGQVIEDPGFEDSFITLQDTAAGTCGGNGQPSCTHTFDFGIPSTLVKSTNVPANTQYIMEHWQTSTGEGWVEVPVNPNSYTATFINDSGSNLSLSNAQYFISPTLIPLDQLNLDNYPASDPQFQTLPGDFSNLAPSPEPSAWLPLASVFLGLLRFRRRIRG